MKKSTVSVVLTVGTPYYDRLTALPKLVFSSTLGAEPLGWENSTLIDEDAVTAIRRLRATTDVPLRSHGSISLNRALLAAGLVDRLEVMIFPVITGHSGYAALFQDGAEFDLLAHFVSMCRYIRGEGSPMSIVYLITLADLFTGVVLAIPAVLFTIRTATALRRADRIVAAVLPIAVVALSVVAELWMAFPFWWPRTVPPETFQYVRMVHFALPLILGFVLVLGLAWPGRRARPSGVAALAPRGLTTYLGRRWVILAAAVLAIILVVTLAAGAASEPDHEGHFTMYHFDVGAASAGTTIYGWFFSVPSLAILGALLLATLAALALIARPPLGADLEHESARRRARTRNALAAATGAMLLHLGAVLASLGGTAALWAQFQAGDLGRITVVPPFAALGPALSGSGFAASALGFALWLLIPLWTIRIRAVSRVAA